MFLLHPSARRFTYLSMGEVAILRSNVKRVKVKDHLWVFEAANASMLEISTRSTVGPTSLARILRYMFL